MEIVSSKDIEEAIAGMNGENRPFAGCWETEKEAVADLADPMFGE